MKKSNLEYFKKQYGTSGIKDGLAKEANDEFIPIRTKKEALKRFNKNESVWELCAEWVDGKHILTTHLVEEKADINNPRSCTLARQKK